MIELLTKGGSQNLLSVTLTDCGNGIGEEDTTSHDIDHVRQLRNLRIEKAIGRHPGHFEDAIAKDAVISQIMDGIDGGGPPIKRVVAIDSVHPIRHNAGVPVVAVNNIG